MDDRNLREKLALKSLAGEAGKPRSIQQKSVFRKEDAHRRFHSIQQKVGAAVRVSQDPSDEDHVAEFRCLRD